MAYYGYDPSKYINDYSWIGDMGQVISKVATQMPELIALNKKIKTEKTFKEESYAASNYFVDNLDHNVLANVASAMQIDIDIGNDVNADEYDQMVKERLKKRIPDYRGQDDKMTNEEYAKQVTNNLFVPFMTAAYSEKGGGALKISDIMSRILSGEVQKQAMSSPIAQQQLGKEQVKQSFEEKNKLEDDRSKQIMKPVNTAYETVMTQFEDPQPMDRLKARNSALKYAKDMEFTQPQVDYLLKQVEDTFDGLLENKKFDLTKQQEERITEDKDTEIAIRKSTAEKERIRKEKEKINPPATGKEYDSQLNKVVTEMQVLQNQINKLVSDSISDEKQGVKAMKDKLEWLQTSRDELERTKTTYAGLASQPEGGTQQNLMSARVQSKNYGDIERNIKAIDDSRAWVKNANSKWGNNPEKIQSILKEGSGPGQPGYLYEIAKGPDGKYAIVLKNKKGEDYTGFQKYLDEGVVPTQDEVTNTQAQQSAIKTAYSGGQTTFDQRKQKVDNMAKTQFEQAKKQNPGASDNDIYEAIYAQLRASGKI